MTATKDGQSIQSSSEAYQGPPPPFGHAMHKYFGFDPEYVNLNHGSYGSLPTPVRVVCDKLTTRIESNPDKFLRLRSYLPLLTDGRERIAKLIGAETDECVIVPNASHGINTVLRNFEWNKEDIIVGTTTTYGSVSRTIQYLSDISPHPSVSTFNLHFPVSHASIVSQFRDHIRSLLSHSPSSGDTEASPNRKIVAVIDSIVSNPGARLPWKEMVQICREEGVWSVVDAAHSIGQELDINLAEAKPDFWISNCHKWLYTKRGCAVLYVPKRNQHIIKSSIPTSHTYISPSDGPDSHFILQFEWNGTIDFVPFLSVPAALDFRNWLGGEVRINEYCHSLALAGGKRLAEVLGTSVMGGSDEITLNMVNVELPLPGDIHFSAEVDRILRERLLLDWNVYGAHYYHNSKWWTRCSAQVWNEISDFEYLGRAFSTVCAEIVQKFGSRA